MPIEVQQPQLAEFSVDITNAAADGSPVKERRRRRLSSATSSASPAPSEKSSPIAGSGVVLAAPMSPSSTASTASSGRLSPVADDNTTGTGAPASLTGSPAAQTAAQVAAILAMPPTCSRPMTGARKIAAGIVAAGHVLALVGVYQMATMPTALLGLKWFVAATLFYLVSGTTGITAGAHRLWSHRSYSASLPARLWLALNNTISNQSSILHWSREHRVHHQYADTAADPYDISRGFFYAHMGWIFSPRTDAFAAAAKLLDSSDLLADPVVRFQDKHYIPLSLLCCFLLPTLIGGYVSGGAYWPAFCILGCYRWVFTLHVTWLVNSLAHFHGDRPYDETLEAREAAAVSFFSGGEGWHNYHHAYPWDYAASETAGTDFFWRFNLTKFWIDCLAAFGWVTGRKVVRNPVRALERVRAAAAAAAAKGGDAHAPYRGTY